jgi:hypothetical protein
MPTYIYRCTTEACEAKGVEVEEVFPMDMRDGCSYCAYCGNVRTRKIAFTGLTWAPTAGGMR